MTTIASRTAVEAVIEANFKKNKKIEKLNTTVDEILLIHHSRDYDMFKKNVPEISGQKKIYAQIDEDIREHRLQSKMKVLQELEERIKSGNTS
jgi:hypothetical protein